MEPPDLEKFDEQYDGDWGNYEDHLRRIFDREIVHGNLWFCDEPVKCDKNRFQHFITEGTGSEPDRNPDLCRCERIRWLPWVIRNAGKHPEIDCSEDESTERVELLFRNEYKVVLGLGRTQNGFELITAYCVRHSGAHGFGP